jgi:hypothetical protein
VYFCIEKYLLYVESKEVAMGKAGMRKLQEKK